MLKPATPRSALGLRSQAVLISFFLVVLIGILGARAYTVARANFRDLAELETQDLRIESGLTQADAEIAAREQAARKLRVTRDPAYAQLLVRHEAALQALSRDILSQLSGPLLAQAPSEWHSSEEVQRTRELLEGARRARIHEAHETSAGLLRLIAAALALTVALTAWLLALFYRGLMRPLRGLEDGLRRVRDGELGWRLASGGPPRGVAELRQLSASFDSMTERLQALDQAKSEFLATISHEIRNPLAALKEGLNLLATQGATLSPESRERAFAASLIASKRLESMINNLLHHSQMEAGLYAFDLTLKDLVSAARTAMDEVRPLAERKRMQIEYAGPRETLAAFNWDGMVQVFENLLSNAIKYGHEESTIEIRVSPSQRQIRAGASVPHLDVSVSNASPPLEESELPHLFERFFRGSNSLARSGTGQPSSGMGLGLHVVKRIVEAHHGGVTARSDGGRMRVQFWIPGRYESEAAV